MYPSKYVDMLEIRVCFQMRGDAVSSGFGCISRRFPAGLVGLSQGESTQKCSQRRRKCASGILETHSSFNLIPFDVFMIQGLNNAHNSRLSIPHGGRDKPAFVSFAFYHIYTLKFQ